MNIFDELKNRDLIEQVTNEEKVKEALSKDKICFYMGIEPTADSLHVGHFVQLMIMSRMQKAGHIPIILFGGGTGLIGDPSGKTDMRKMLTVEQIEHNIECFKKQAAKFIDLTPGKAFVVNNADWLLKLNYIDFLRDIGVHFSVNRMLAAECYKQRLERGLTFFEMNYMIMQGYDFLVLSQKYDCKLELGGNDQWSNIIAGVELVRRHDQKEVYGMTFKLLENSDGKKMGKTEKGALWLDASKTSPYEFYQYWRNVEDSRVIRCMQMLTFIPTEEINEYAKLEGQDINKAKEVLAYEVTKLVHGEKEAEKCMEAAKSIFGSNNFQNENIPLKKLSGEDLENNEIDILSLLCKSELCSSKSEARRLVQQGGASIDNEKITDTEFKIDRAQLEKGIMIKKGKKTFLKVAI